MFSWLKTSVIVLCALAACALVAASFFLGTRMLTDFGKSPAHFLPAAETVALFSNADAAMLDQWKGAFPALHTDLGSEATVALIDTGNAVEAVVFANPLTNLDGLRVGPFLLQGSEAALRIIEQSPARLIAEEGYQHIASGQKRSSSWLYMKKSALPAPLDERSLMPALLQSMLLQNGTHVGMVPEENGFRVVIAGVDGKDLHAINTSIPAIYADGWTMALGNPKKSLKTVTRGLTTDHLLIFQGMLMQRIEDTFGTLISWDYDLLPLLEEPMVFHVSGSGSARTFIAIGSLDDRRRLSSTLDKMHLSFRAARAQGSVTQRTFDDGRFTSEILRMDPEAIEEAVEDVNGWNVHTTSDNETTLTTALNGDRFFLTNDPTGFDRWHLSSGTVTNLPKREALSAGDLVAGGILDAASMMAIKDRFPLGLLRNAKGSLIWSMEQKGSTAFVTIKTP